MKKEENEKKHFNWNVKFSILTKFPSKTETEAEKAYVSQTNAEGFFTSNWH